MARYDTTYVCALHLVIPSTCTFSSCCSLLNAHCIHYSPLNFTFDFLACSLSFSSVSVASLPTTRFFTPALYLLLMCNIHLLLSIAPDFYCFCFEIGLFLRAFCIHCCLVSRSLSITIGFELWLVQQTMNARHHFTFRNVIRTHAHTINVFFFWYLQCSDGSTISSW